MGSLDCTLQYSNNHTPALLPLTLPALLVLMVGHAQFIETFYVVDCCAQLAFTYASPAFMTTDGVIIIGLLLATSVRL